MESHEQHADEQSAYDLDTALALSGGGYRATLFGLGALLALSDTGASQRVTSIASVSGGSLANGAMAARLDYHTATREQVEEHVAAIGRLIATPPVARSGPAQKLAIAAVLAVAIAVLVLPWWLTPDDVGVDLDWADRHADEIRAGVVAAGAVIVGVLLRILVTGGGPLFGWWGTWAYFGALVALGEATFAGIPRLGDVPDRLLYAAGVLLLLAGFTLRGRVTGRAFAANLFPDGGSTRLADLKRELDHVICATDLHAGEHVYFAPKFVYAYRFGLGSPGRPPLHAPVQASAAFPGAFPVRWTWRRRFDFKQAGAEPNVSEHRTPPFLALVDGGVYDNMGDEWAQSLSTRPDGPYREAAALIVVNASAGLPYGAVWRLALPVAGGALAFWREKSVLYDSGTAQRRRAMTRQFDLAAHGGGGLHGTLVHIGQNPYKAPHAFKHAAEPWGSRAQFALDFLDAPGSRPENDWTAAAADNAAVPITLVGFDRDTAARLVHHGYVLAAVNAHMFLGHPLPSSPRGYEAIRGLLAD